MTASAFSREFGLRPLAEQTARIEELTGAPVLTPREQRLLGRLRRTHGRLAKGLETAPFETALARGVINAVAPLDFDDPASLAARTAQAETITAAYGVPISPLRSAEARALEARLDGTAPEALPDALADLRAGFGDAAMVEVARGLETDRPHLAVALRLAKDRPEIAADVLEGGRRLKQAVADGKADTLRPSEAELRAASARVYGSETAYRSRPAEGEAAAALYALRTANTTKPGFQPAVYEQALRDVAAAGTLIDDFGALGVPAADADLSAPGLDVPQTPTQANPQAVPTADDGIADGQSQLPPTLAPDAPGGLSSQSPDPTEASKEGLANFLRDKGLSRLSPEAIATMLDDPDTVKELQRSFGPAIARQEAAAASGQPPDSGVADGDVLFDIPSTPKEDLRQFLKSRGHSAEVIEATLRDPDRVRGLLNSPPFLQRNDASASGQGPDRATSGSGPGMSSLITTRKIVEERWRRDLITEKDFREQSAALDSKLILAIRRGSLQSKQAFVATAVTLGVDPSTAAVEIARLQREIDKLPRPASVDRFSKATDYFPLFIELAKAPLEIPLTLIFEGIGSNTAEAATAAVVGGLTALASGPAAPVTGPVAGTTAAIAVSLAETVGGEVLEILQEEGNIDLTSEGQIVAALRNPKLMARAKALAQRKGMTIEALNLVLPFLSKKMVKKIVDVTQKVGGGKTTQKVVEKVSEKATGAAEAVTIKSAGDLASGDVTKPGDKVGAAATSMIPGIPKKVPGVTKSKK